MPEPEDREGADRTDFAEDRFEALDRALFAPSGDGVQARTALFERIIESLDAFITQRREADTEVLRSPGHEAPPRGEGGIPAQLSASARLRVRPAGQRGGNPCCSRQVRRWTGIDRGAQRDRLAEIQQRPRGRILGSGGDIAA
jgi:hypothetical protein